MGGVLLLFLIFIGGLVHVIQKTNYGCETLILTGPRDEEGPIEVENKCMEKLQEYLAEPDCKLKGCEIQESRVGFTEEECPNGLSKNGCYYCIFKCY